MQQQQSTMMERKARMMKSKPMPTQKGTSNPTKMLGRETTKMGNYKVTRKMPTRSQVEKSVRKSMGYM